MRWFLCALIAAGVCLPGSTAADTRRPQLTPTYLEWSNETNRASARRYSAHNAMIITVDEFIADDNGGYFADWYGEADTVLMHGRALDGVIIIRPIVAGCWSLEMTTDDPGFTEQWRSVMPCVGRAYLPVVYR